MNIKTQLQKMNISDIKWIANSLNIKLIAITELKDKLLTKLVLSIVMPWSRHYIWFF